MFRAVFKTIYDMAANALNSFSTPASDDIRKNRSPNAPSNQERLIAIGLIDKYKQVDTNRLPDSFLCSIMAELLNIPVMIDEYIFHVIDKSTYLGLKKINIRGDHEHPFTRKPIKFPTNYNKTQYQDNIRRIREEISESIPVQELAELIKRSSEAQIIYDRAMRNHQHRLEDRELFSESVYDQEEIDFIRNIMKLVEEELPPSTSELTKAIRFSILNFALEKQLKQRGFSSTEVLLSEEKAAEYLRNKVNSTSPAYLHKLRKKTLYYIIETALTKRGLTRQKADHLLALFKKLHKLNNDVIRDDLELKLTEQIEKFIAQLEKIHVLNAQLASLPDDLTQREAKIRSLAEKKCETPEQQQAFIRVQMEELMRDLESTKFGLLKQLKNLLEAHILFTEQIIHEEPPNFGDKEETLEDKISRILDDKKKLLEETKESLMVLQQQDDVPAPEPAPVPEPARKATSPFLRMLGTPRPAPQGLVGIMLKHQFGVFNSPAIHGAGLISPHLRHLIPNPMHTPAKR